MITSYLISVGVVGSLYVTLIGVAIFGWMFIGTGAATAVVTGRTAGGGGTIQEATRNITKCTKIYGNKECMIVNHDYVQKIARVCKNIDIGDLTYKLLHKNLDHAILHETVKTRSQSATTKPNNSDGERIL